MNFPPLDNCVKREELRAQVCRSGCGMSKVKYELAFFSYVNHSLFMGRDLELFLQLHNYCNVIIYHPNLSHANDT